ncbi:uncharacterized protein LOC141613239 [Silene latifolia]|uniref:uncharacterized protein LOC141613239 n=1 Tax=Silene latifolia TaxID=37657 RepID=UPI003D77E546
MTEFPVLGGQKGDTGGNTWGNTPDAPLVIPVAPLVTPTPTRPTSIFTPARILTRITRHESRLLGSKEGNFLVDYNKEMSGCAEMVDKEGRGEMTDQIIHVKVKERINNRSFYATFVYGFNKVVEGVPLWNDLIRIQVQEPWIVLGDFNNVMYANERIGGIVKDQEMLPFQDTADECDLQDIKSYGAIFTWNNKQPSLQEVEVAETNSEELNCSLFSDIERNADVAYKIMIDAEVQLQKDPYNFKMMDNEKQARDSYHLLAASREEFMRQKAKCAWAKEGDANTAIFHQNLLGSSLPTTDVLKHVVMTRTQISRDTWAAMCRIPSEEDIRTIIFAIPDEKRPGPNGYTSKFYKAIWHYYKSSGQLLQQIISKLLCERIASSLPEVINAAQSAFIQGRTILDDLLLFCKGDVRSVTILMEDFKVFTATTGLNISSEKYNIYLNGVDSDEAKAILDATGFKRGVLPFKYLGVGISHKKLSKIDCNILMDKMLARIRGWNKRKLSYYARLVLVKAVLATIHTYWAQIFVLHVGDLGGLGLTDSRVWNLAAIGKLAWWIQMKKYMLWIRWIDSIYLKGRPWLMYTPTLNSSWAWRMICDVKEKFKDAYEIGMWQLDTNAHTIAKGYSWLSKSNNQKEITSSSSYAEKLCGSGIILPNLDGAEFLQVGAVCPKT